MLAHQFLNLAFRKDSPSGWIKSIVEWYLMSAIWVFKEITLRSAGGGWARHHHKWIMMNNSGSGLLLLLIFALFVPVPSNRSPRASDWPVQSSDWSARSLSAQPGLISPGQNVCLGYQVTWLVRPSHGPHRLGFLALFLSLSPILHWPFWLRPSHWTNIAN